MAKRRRELDSDGIASETAKFKAVFVDTSLNTHLAVLVSSSDTVSDFKKKMALEHTRCFPNTGEILIHSLKVKRRLNFYHLTDAMLVWSVFYGVKRNWFLSADVSGARTCHLIKHSCEIDINNGVKMDTTKNDDNCRQTPPIPLLDGPTERNVILDPVISSDIKKKRKRRKKKANNSDSEKPGTEQTDNGTLGFCPPSTDHIAQETGKEEDMTNHEGKDAQGFLDSSAGGVAEKVQDFNLRNKEDSVMLTQTEQTLEDVGSWKKNREQKAQSSARNFRADFPAVEIQNPNQVDNSNENTERKDRKPSKKRKITASKVQEYFPVNQQVGIEAVATKEALISSVNSEEDARHIDSSQVLSSKITEKQNNKHGIAESTYDPTLTSEKECEGINFKHYFVPGQHEEKVDSGDKVKYSIKSNQEMETPKKIKNNVTPSVSNSTELQSSIKSFENKKAENRSSRKGSGRSIEESGQNSDRGEMISNSFTRSSGASENGAKGSRPSEMCETVLQKPDEILAAPSLPNNSTKSLKKGSSTSIGESAQNADRGEMISNSFRRSSGASENVVNGSRPSEMCETVLQKPDEILAASSLPKNSLKSRRKGSSSRSIGESAQNADWGETISNSVRRSSEASENGANGSTSSLLNNSSKSRRKGSSRSIGESAQNADRVETIFNSFRRSSEASEIGANGSRPSEMCEIGLQKPDEILAASSLLNNSSKSCRKGRSRSIGESAQNSDRDEMISNSFRRSSGASENGAKGSRPSEMCDTTLQKSDEILVASSLLNNSSKSCGKGSGRSIGESAPNSDRGEMISNSFGRSSGASENGVKGSRSSEMCETVLQKPDEILAASSLLNNSSKSLRKDSSRSMGESAQNSGSGEMISNSFRRSSGASENGAKGSRPNELCEIDGILSTSSRRNKNHGLPEKSTLERSEIFPGKKENKRLHSGMHVTYMMPMKTPQKKSLLNKSGAIFLENSGESSGDENGTMHSDGSTHSPSDSSSGSDSSVQESDTSQDSTRNEGRSTGRRNMSKLDLSASKDDMTMDMILRSSKRFQKAKFVASQDEDKQKESRPIEFVPDSQAS